MTMALVFEGQGSQRVGMGRELFEQFPEVLAEASDIAGFDVEELCLKDPEGRLKQTQFTQVAIFVVNHLKYLGVREQWPRPSLLLGHSLGEYNALLAAGAFDFATGLRLVKERGRLMGLATDGAMAAVVGLEPPAIEAVIRAAGCQQEVYLANFNSRQQTVVSGRRSWVVRLQKELQSAGAKIVVPLNVSGAFHTPFMEPARRELEPLLQRTRFLPLRGEVVANVTGRPHGEGPLGEVLGAQVVSPVLWRQSVEYALAAGVDSFREIGASGALTKLIEQVKSEYRPPAPVARLPAERRPPAPVPAQASGQAQGGFHLGSPSFRREYDTRSTYVSGGMYKGISSKELVVRMGRAGHLSFFGTGGLDEAEIGAGIEHIQTQLNGGQPYGMNLVCNLMRPEKEVETVQVFLRRGITVVEASAFLRITKSLVLYRVKGLRRAPDGSVTAPHRVLAKISRPEVAEAFLQPPPEKLVRELVEEGLLTSQEAELSPRVLMANDLCVEADSGGHTDQGNPFALLPSLMSLRRRLAQGDPRVEQVRIGAAGGIGTPQAMAAAYIMGADFVVTGSINQATVEAGTSEAVKDLLVRIDIQDTAYAPAGDMFEIGARVQVLKKGLFFPARANKLYDLYRNHESLEELDPRTVEMLESKYFQRSIGEVWRETQAYYAATNPAELTKAERVPKHKMALVFKWYFFHTGRLALTGSAQQRVDYQIHCGPSLGAFNQWVRGTRYEDWRNRHVDEIADHLLRETEAHLRSAFARLSLQPVEPAPRLEAVR